RRSEDFWYTDSGIILIAEGVACCVYQGLLSCHSTVFRELFIFPQPSYAETMDGCHMVYLSNSSRDLTDVLRALFGSDLYYSWPGEHPAFSVLAALVRLKHKYEMKALRDQALNDLKAIFTLQACPNTAPFEMTQQDAITVIALAHLTNTHSRLPMAFYVCCQLDLDCIVNGSEVDGCREHLSTDDMIKCLGAKLELAKD
ncbi:hypothetical protein OBBRIDRAFT_697033, partial [Obba rivulosa]